MIHKNHHITLFRINFHFLLNVTFVFMCNYAGNVLDKWLDSFFFFFRAEDKINFEAQKEVYMRWKSEAENLKTLLEEQQVGKYLFALQSQVSCVFLSCP